MKKNAKKKPALNRAPRLWETMTVEDMRDALKKTRTAILPLGVTEQHGYHLPLCTDTYDAYETAKLISAATGAVVAPPLAYSFSGGELPGTINVSPQVMSLMVQEIVRDILRNGFKNVVILLGHGGSENFLALENALQLFLRSNPGLNDVLIVFAPVWKFSKAWNNEFHKGDFHAGRTETSLMLALGPHLVKTDRIITDKPALLKLMCHNPDNYQRVETLHPSPHVVRRVGQRPDIKVGVMGFPREATAEYGRQIVKATVAGIANLIRNMERKKFKKYREVKIKRAKVVID